MRRLGKLAVATALVVRIGCAISLVATAGGPLSAAGVQAPRLLSATGEGVAFEVAVPWAGLTLETVTAGGKEYVRVSLPGWAATARAGAPLLPFVAEAVGVPFGAELGVRVEPGSAHTVALRAPCLPVTTQTVEWGPPAGPAGIPVLPGPSFVVEEDPAIYSGGAAYPGVLAEVTSDGVVRRQRVAGIAAYPVQYDPATRQLTVYERLRIEITFKGTAAAGGAPSGDSPAYENLFREGLLNYGAARAWRRRIAPAALLVSEGIGRASLPWAPPVPGWRVKVREEGLYKLTYAELQKAGLQVDSLDPRSFRLHHLGSEVAVTVSGEDDGRFDPADTLLFYGRPVDSKYTRDNVYWLSYGQGAGLRMGSRSGAPGAADTPEYYPARRRMEGSGFYVPNAPGDDALERWLWDYVYPPSRPSWTHTFSLTAPYTGTYPATLRVDLLGFLQSAVNPDHHAVISLNGVSLGDAWWDGFAWRTVETPVEPSLLAVGNNTVTVSCPNDTGVGYDLVFIDRAELEFANTYVAEGDVLPFRQDEAGTWDFQVGGFSSDQLAVYDVTDPMAVARIVGIAAVPSGPGYAAVFQDEVAAPTAYWAAADTAYRMVQAIEADTSSDLQSAANGADYIVLTHQAFWTQAQTLRDYRASQGLRSVRVDVQDVYDEFGYGIEGAAAIHDFLAYAYGNWAAPAPSFVLLLGDGHYDPKNYLGFGRVSYLPPYLAAVDPWITETAADNRYVTLVGADAFPDMMLGRLAVNSSAEASAFVTKIVAYEQNPVPGDWQRQVLAVVDDADSAGDFAQSSDNLLACCLPAPYQANKVYYGVTHGTVAGARAAILGGINAGKLIVNYVGHAASTQWANEGLFKAANVAGLTNGGKLPVMLPMTCYDGYYHYPYLPAAGYDATAEVVTRADGKGAVASWSPTGLGVATGHDYLDQGFFRAVFQDGRRTLGQATTAGKLGLWATGAGLFLLDTYLLFGDPAQRIPTLDADLQVAKTVEPPGHVRPGDVLTYTLTFTNAGPATAFHVVLTDAIPALLVHPVVVYASPEVISATEGITFAWTIADLLPGDGGRVQVTGTVRPTTRMGGVIVNEAQVTTTIPDLVPANNVVSVTTTISATDAVEVYLPLVLRSRPEPPE